jgi:adenylate kinase family enzyme
MIKRVLHRAEENERSDDTEEIVQKRLRTYYSQTKEVVD